MKRHRSLVPLSHDHHHALVEARRLGRGADGDEAARLVAVDGFLRFFSTETIPHFRQEEEQLFPLITNHDSAAGALVVQALLEHQRIHTLAHRLEQDFAVNKADDALMRELGALVGAHVRLEERQLFPLIESAVSSEAADELDLEASRESTSPVVDLARPAGSGPIWGTETEELNATLLAWPAGKGPTTHVNRERDVIVVVLEKNRTRSITAGPEGVRYLSIHRRRAPLKIRPMLPQEHE